MKPLFYILTLMTLTTSCGVHENSQNHMFALNERQATMERTDAREIPFPLYGCKAAYRVVAKNTNIKSTYERLLGQNRIPIVNYDSIEYRTYEASMIAEWNLTPPIHPLYISSFKGSFKKIVIDGYRAHMKKELQKFEQGFDEYQGGLPNITLVAIANSEFSGFLDIYRDTSANHIPCSFALRDYLYSGIPQEGVGFYKTIGRYYEPARNTNIIAPIFTYKDDEYSFDIADLDGTHYFEIEANRIPISFKDMFNALVLFPYSGNDIDVSGTQMQFITSQLSGRPPAYNTITRLEEEKMDLQKQGLPGFWKESDAFESEWNLVFNELRLRLDGCGLVFEGAIKNTSIEIPSPVCTTSVIANSGSVINSLGVTLTLLDMAGMAHSEGDLESANELLSIAKETLKFAADVAIGLSPAGRAKDIIEAISGHSLIPPDFEKLSIPVRVVAGVGSVTVGSTTLKIIAKFAGKSRILKRLVAVEADKVTKVFEVGDEILDEIRSRLPKTNGSWIGERGKGVWVSSNDRVNAITNGEGIPFKNYFPDFSKWSMDKFKVSGLNGKNSNDFPLVDQIIAQKYNLSSQTAAKQWRINNKLTIHHMEDGVSVQLVPTDLHSNVSHLGGAAILKKIYQTQ